MKLALKDFWASLLPIERKAYWEVLRPGQQPSQSSCRAIPLLMSTAQSPQKPAGFVSFLINHLTKPDPTILLPSITWVFNILSSF